MARIGVKILLEYGHFIAVTMEEADARGLIEAWKSEEYGTLEGSDQVGGEQWHWCVRTNRVVSIHTFVLGAEQKPVHQPGGNWPWPKASGPH